MLLGMKHLIFSLMAASLTSTVLAATPVKESDLPSAFKKEPPYIQNQICGELMAEMARLSAGLYRSSRLPDMREAAVLTGTRAMVFVRATAVLSDAEMARAKRIAKQLEKGTSPASMLPLRFCEERAQRWLKEGTITQADVAITEKEVRAALDKAIPPKR